MTQQVFSHLTKIGLLPVFIISVSGLWSASHLARNLSFILDFSPSLPTCVCVCVRSRVWLFVTPQNIAHQAPLSMRFSRQEYWSGLPFPSPGDLPNPGIELESPTSPALAGRFFTTGATWEAQLLIMISINYDPSSIIFYVCFYPCLSLPCFQVSSD